MGFSGDGAVRAMKPGDFQATVFPGTQAGIQSALDYCSSPGGEVRLGPGTYTGITNLTVYGKTTLSGSGALNTILKRDPAATGTCLREKTAAEGNSQGAAGIVVRDLFIYANGSAGDGIDFGNQGGALFTSVASLSGVAVRDFTSGTAIRLKADAIECSNLWAVTSNIGLELSGGNYNKFYGLWLEDNATTQLWTNEPGDKFFGVHLEDNAGAGPLLDLAAAGAGAVLNEFYGLEMKVDGAQTNLITIRSGITSNQFHGIRSYGAGSWTDTIHSDAYGTVADNTVLFIPFYLDQHSSTYGIRSYIRNAVNNDTTSISATAWSLGYALVQKKVGLTDAATIATDASRGNFFTVQLGDNRTMGAPTNPSLGQTITYKVSQDGTGGRTLAWDAAFKQAWSDTGNTSTKFSTISFTYDGAKWSQCGAQSPYI